MQPWVIVAALAALTVITTMISAILLQLTLLGAAGYGVWWYITTHPSMDQYVKKVQTFVDKHL